MPTQEIPAESPVPDLNCRPDQKSLHQPACTEPVPFLGPYRAETDRPSVPLIGLHRISTQPDARASATSRDPKKGYAVSPPHASNRRASVTHGAGHCRAASPREIYINSTLQVKAQTSRRNPLSGGGGSRDLRRHQGSAKQQLTDETRNIYSRHSELHSNKNFRRKSRAPPSIFASGDSDNRGRPCPFAQKDCLFASGPPAEL